MSGAEASLVTGLISSVISIVQATIQVDSAYNDKAGLPKAFRQVAEKLPLIEDSLHLVKESAINNDSSALIQPVVASCEVKAGRLKDIFDQVLPEHPSKRRERYLKALSTLRKGSRVEDLTKDILSDLNTLPAHCTFTLAAKDKLATAVDDIGKAEKSAPDDVFEKDTFSVNNFGGANNVTYQARENQYIQTGPGFMFAGTVAGGNFGTSK